MKFIEDAKRINFDEARHVYTQDKNELISVTKFISHFANEFDADGSILLRKSAELKISPEALRKQWDDKRDKASEYGTGLHKSIEYYLNTSKIRRNEYSDIIKKFKENFKFKGELFSEVMLYDLDIGICGTADLVQVIDNKIVQIHDFKTNEKPLSDYSFGKKMLKPLTHLNDSKLTKYFLQISMYLYILSSKYGYEIGENNYLFWLNRKKREFEKIPIQLKMDEVVDIISHWMYRKALNE